MGHTFEQRFESLVVQREKYLRRVVRYIALNPVKAHLCRDAADWPWSTHRATAGLEDAPRGSIWIGCAGPSAPTSSSRHSATITLCMKDPAGPTWSFDLAAALGTARFKKAVAESLAQGKNRPIPFDCRRCAQPPLESVFTGEEADRRSRDALILVARMTHGYRLAEIARFLTVSPSTSVRH